MIVERRIIVMAVVACLLFGLTFAVGFLSGGPSGKTAQAGNFAAWSDLPSPVDYSGSTRRMAVDLARLGLFGPFSPASTTTPTTTEMTSDPELSLVAIATLDGRKVALVNDGKPFAVRLSEGQTTESGWRVEEIGDAEITLSKASTSRTLKLFPSQSTSGEAE